MPALVRKLLFDWRVWLLRRKLLRTFPELREIDDLERKARRGHKAVRHLVAARSRIVHAKLARELGR